VIEINDNPNLDVGAEDKVLGDEVYRRLLGHLLAKFEARNGASPSQLVSMSELLVLPDSTRGLPSPLSLRETTARTSH
jgi:hypothetical protein